MFVSGINSIRISIPHSCGGALIGTGGANVKRINQSTSCIIRCADSSDPYNIDERLVTIVSAIDENVLAVETPLTTVFLCINL